MGAMSPALSPFTVAIYTGSAPGSSPVFAEATALAVRAIIARGLGVVYGGGKVGLMGVVADTTLAAGGSVTGVMPRSLVDGEIAHTGLTELEIVADMHERKARMAALAGAFIAFPGGSGTLEELFEVWTWQQLGLHHNPVALFNVDGFWDPLLAAIDAMVSTGFIAARYREALIVDADIESLLDRVDAWQPPAAKWPAPAADPAVPEIS